jgi:hypothetical protein
MKTIKSIIEIEEYDSLNELSEEDKQLLLLARQGRMRLMPRIGISSWGSNTNGNGNVVEGCNQENSSYPWVLAPSVRHYFLLRANFG